MEMIKKERSCKVLVKPKEKQSRCEIKQPLLGSLKRRNCVGGGEIIGEKIMAEDRDFSERMRKHEIIGDDSVVCESKSRAGEIIWRL